MNANQIAQVAQHLNVSPNQIKRCEEWSKVLFVVVHGCRPRFVSKKVLKTMEDQMNEYLASCQAQDDYCDKVEAMAAHLYDCLPVGSNPTYSVIQHIAGDVVDGKLTEQEAIARLSSKKVIIKKK